ncbi:hypothetical protein FNF28_06184 [Cafeteria roenbergensis]|uniref:Uncharacterized protein n=1 Tax=Cafeteria roenbergensis TaxID=33653 RepID=A0A5A8CZL7_CAFRO|nr:hypothetical protein FNF28_06184 [Cafeteria roenbergensis]
MAAAVGADAAAAAAVAAAPAADEAAIIGTEVGNNSTRVFTRYVVRVTLGPETLQASRRYNDFRQLDGAVRALSAGKRPGKQGLPHLTGRTWGKGTQERVVAKRRPKLEAYLKEVVSLAASFPAIRRLVVQFMTDGMSPGSGRPSSEHSLSSSAGDAGRRGRLSSMSSSCYMCGRPLAPDLAPPAGESASGELHLFCSATCEAYFDRARALGMEVDRTAQSAVLAPARTSAASDPDAGRAAPAAISSPRSAAGSAEAVVVSRPSLDPSAESSRQLLLRAAGATRGDGGPGPLGAPGATPGQVAVFRDSSAAAPGQAAEGADPAEAVTQPVLLGSTQAPEEEAARSAVVGASGSRRGHHAAAASEFGVAGDDSPAPPLRETRRRTMLASLGDSLRRMSTTAESSAQQSNEAVVKRGGHLWKRGGFRGGRQNWKRRFFCLMDRALHYYQETTPTLLGVMPLVGSATPGPAALGGGSAFFATVKLLTEAEARQAGAPARASKDGRWAFSVSTPQRVLLLCAENAADRQSWADAVTALVAKHRATHSPRETEPLAPPTLADPVPLTPNTPQTSVAGSQPRHSVASARGMLGEEWMPQLSGGTWEVAEDEIEVTERIGEGAFGDVYRGRLWGTDVAVKLVRKGVAELGSEALEALRAEVTVLSQLRHPNVVLYLGAGTRPPSVFIVTEWCERGDLNCLLYDTAAPLSVAARVRLALHAAQGLTYLHSQRRGIVHRDLKSHNLLLTRHYILKVADFGLTVFQGELAKVAAPEDAATEEDAAAPGGGPADGAVGTPQWMAPEVLEGHRYDEKVDVYSFGVVLAELCSRVEPYSDRFKRWDFVEAVLEEGAAPTMPLWADAPPPVDDVIAAEAQLTTLEARTKPPQAAAAQPQAARQRSHSNASGHSDAHSTSSRRRQAAPLGASAPTTDGSGPGSLGGAGASVGSPAHSFKASSRGSFSHLSLPQLSRALQDAAGLRDDDFQTRTTEPLVAPAGAASPPPILPAMFRRLPLWWTSDAAFCAALAGAADPSTCLVPGPSAAGGVGSTVAFALAALPEPGRATRDLAMGDAPLVAALRQARSGLLAVPEGERFPSRVKPAESLSAEWRSLPGRAEEWRCMHGDCTGVLQLLATACLSRDPDKRPSFDEIADLLGALLASQQGRMFLELEVPRFREELAYGSRQVQLRAAAEISHVASHALLAASRALCPAGSADAAGLWFPGLDCDVAVHYERQALEEPADREAALRPGASAATARVPDALWACADLPFAFASTLGAAAVASAGPAAAFAAEPRCPVSACDTPALRQGAPELVAALAGCMRAHGAMLRLHAGLPLEADATPAVLAQLEELAAAGVFGLPAGAAPLARRRTVSGTTSPPAEPKQHRAGPKSSAAQGQPRPAGAVLVPVSRRARDAAAAQAAAAQAAAELPPKRDDGPADPTPSKAKPVRRARRGKARGPVGPTAAESQELLTRCVEALAVLLRASVATPRPEPEEPLSPAQAAAEAELARLREVSDSVGLLWLRVRDCLLPSLGRLAHSLSLLAVCPGSKHGEGPLPSELWPRDAAAAAALLVACWSACPGQRARGLLAFTISHTLAHAVAAAAEADSTPARAALRCRALLELKLGDASAGLPSAELRAACIAVLDRVIMFE